METNRIKVKSEFAPLKKVVLTQSEFIFPARVENFKDDAFLSKESLNLLDGVDTAAKNYKEVFPERQRKWENERENLKKVLEKYGVEVVRP